MVSFSPTYRLIAATIALLFFAGGSVPAGLHIGQMVSDHCKKLVSKPGADDSAYKAISYNAENTSTDSSGKIMKCNLGFACACCIDHAPVKTRSAEIFSRIPIDFSPVVIDFISQHKAVPLAAFNTNKTEVSEASPPLFLKNSSFLN